MVVLSSKSPKQTKKSGKSLLKVVLSPPLIPHPQRIRPINLIQRLQSDRFPLLHQQHQNGNRMISITTIYHNNNITKSVSSSQLSSYPSRYRYASRSKNNRKFQNDPQNVAKITTSYPPTRRKSPQRISGKCTPQSNACT